MRNRIFPEDRVRIITHIEKIDKSLYFYESDEFFKKLVASKVAAEIANKLMEHHKVLIRDTGDFVLFSMTLEIIVPEPTYSDAP